MENKIWSIACFVVLTMLFATSCMESSTPSSGSSAATEANDGSTVIDVDGNEYHAVKIGSQVWMKENLRTAHLRDGSAIPNVIDSAEWIGLSSDAWCYYDNKAGYDDTYGKLYNWYAAANPKICPLGWHVPTDADWKILVTYLGMPPRDAENWGWRGDLQNVGGKMKSTTLWDSPNTGATNASGFSGLPGGQRKNGDFMHESGLGYWWSATERNSEGAWHRKLGYSYGSFNRHHNFKSNGFCIRCVQD